MGQSRDYLGLEEMKEEIQIYIAAQLSLSLSLPVCVCARTPASGEIPWGSFTTMSQNQYSIKERSRGDRDSLGRSHGSTLLRSTSTIGGRCPEKPILPKTFGARYSRMSSSSLGWNRNLGGNSASTMHTKLMDISLCLSLALYLLRVHLEGRKYRNLPRIETKWLGTQLRLCHVSMRDYLRREVYIWCAVQVAMSSQIEIVFSSFLSSEYTTNRICFNFKWSLLQILRSLSRLNLASLPEQKVIGSVRLAYHCRFQTRK